MQINEEVEHSGKVHLDPIKIQQYWDENERWSFLYEVQ